MDIRDLNISIDLFESGKELNRFLTLAGYTEHQRFIIHDKYEGIAWSKTANGQYALFLSVLTSLPEFLNK